jgi:Fe(3+) dicitrate transport protein
MLKTFTSILLTVFMVINFSFAQSYQINGTITDHKGKKVQKAIIHLKGTVRTIESDEYGQYVIKGLENGNYTLVFQALEYNTKEVNLTLGNDMHVKEDIVLEDLAFTINDIHIEGRRSVRSNDNLKEIEGFSINATKKNELIKLANIDANLAMNNSRQIFGRTPGISVWENEGSGIQLNIASRGLSPNRSWEFNTRMNGYDITPDPMGYPEAYYTPPMEVVDRIEVIRGASSLQYGPQFGGLLNFILRKPDLSKSFVFESQNTVGSNGLLSTFNYIGGTEGKLNYTAYYQKRKGDGWRENNGFNTDHAHAELSYAFNKKLKLGIEATYMTYLSQQPGGLTEAQFSTNPQQSTRSRNWFSTPWFIPSAHLEYIANESTKLSVKTFGLIAHRSSVGFVKSANITDDNSKRQVDIDKYNNLGVEARLLHDYKVLNKKWTVATGLRYYDGNIDRFQLGTGSPDNNVNFSLVEGDYGRALDFNNNNFSVFAENVFRVSKRLLFTGGLRLETITSDMEGRLTSGVLAPINRNRQFVLFGGGLEYHIGSGTEVYSNLSQAYRPILISDLTPPATTDVIDENLYDARGYNYDLGYRGKIGSFLQFDADVFYLKYGNRIGTITKFNELGKSYQFRTNLGESVSKGTEVYVEMDFFNLLDLSSKIGYLSGFASLSYIDARYTSLISTSLVNGKIIENRMDGNRVENAPQNINRFGASYRKSGFSATWQMSSIGDAFADASNEVKANATATTGLIPAYMVQDLSVSFQFLKNYNLKAGVNNLNNSVYFTRRAGGYPGPGILPADGRNWYISAGIKI